MGKKRSRFYSSTILRDYSPLIFAGSFLLAMVIVGIRLLSFNMDKFKDYQKDKSELAEMNKRVSLFKGLEDENFLQMRQVTESVLPKEKPVFLVLSNLNVIANEVGVKISQLESSPGNLATGSAQLSLAERSNSKRSTKLKTKSFETFPFTLQIEGQSSAVEGFMLKITKLSPLVDLEEVRFSPRGESEKGETNFVGELDLLVYWKKGEEFKFSDEKKPIPISDDLKDVLKKASVLTNY